MEGRQLLAGSICDIAHIPGVFGIVGLDRNENAGRDTHATRASVSLTSEIRVCSDHVQAGD